MDVRLSPEQQALRDSAAQVVDRLGPKAVGELDDAERTAKLDAAIAASGWRELRVADEGSAPLASGVEAALIAEELGRGLADAPFLGPTLAADLRRLTGAPCASGPETVVLTHDLAALAPVVGGVLPHDAVAVDATDAALALVLVAGPDGPALAEVPVSPAETQIDLTRSVAVAAGADALVVVADQARSLSDDDLARWSALALALTSADLVGVMRGAVDLSVAYAAERRQYGAAIGSFQAVQHLLADAFVAMEGSRSLTLHAAWAVDALPPADAVAAASMAKAYSARAALAVCETAIQVHGGIGNTWECLAHVYLRRALLSIDVLGGVGPNLDRVLAHAGIGGS
ncbi:acyl-CoA dehydrogenase family protein [Aquihabitans sp. McL0605]|uniref:acyl-CoA dehydrogenase family protein n=1 Tax=Aquihabitans sp. McL0605 TaxID=3415671 RepID=UPI003CE69582